MLLNSNICLVAFSMLTFMGRCLAQADETTVRMPEDLPTDDVASEVNDLMEEEAEDEDSLFTEDIKGMNLTSVEVLTVLGSVRGTMQRSIKTNSTFFAFKGIPYAQPPVLDLRFKPPVPVNAWGSLDAFDFGDECIQPDVYGLNEQLGYLGNEDCLYLNIFAPNLPTESQETSANASPRPVMFWIHGGGFKYGSADFYNPEELVTREDVVVVTINYRLGALGFFSLENDLAPGNLGLRDQIQALDWVQRYIRAFGGDPDRVTIFGESAGGISVHALTMSPMAAGLFSQAIAQSGTALFSPEHNPGSTRMTYLKFASHFDCDKGDASQVLDCLRLVDADQLVLKKKTEAEGQQNATSNGIQEDDVPDITEYDIVWLPVVDSYSASPVLPLDPLTAMAIGSIMRIPLMLGTVTNEGALLANDFPTKGGANSSEVDWKKLTASTMITKTDLPDSVTDEEVLKTQVLAKFYTGGLDSEFDLDWSDFLTDALFLSADQKVAELTAKHNPNVFNYRLTHSANSSLAHVYGAGGSTYSPVHADDLQYIFNMDNLFGLRQPEEQVLSETMMKYWANFAKYGHPSPLASDNQPHWLPYGENKRYMELKPEPEMQENLEPLRMYLWNKMVWHSREQQIEEKHKPRRSQ